MVKNGNREDIIISKKTINEVGISLHKKLQSKNVNN